MTMEEAAQIYYINKEIEILQMELAKLEESRQYYKPNIMSDMPKGSGGYRNMTDDYLVKRDELKDALDYSLKRLQQKRQQFERFLDTVDDSEIRMILRLRCVNNMRWDDIGKEIGMDRRTVSRKFHAFFENCPQCPQEI